MTDGDISWGEFYSYQMCPYRFFLKQSNVVDLSVINKAAKQHGLEFHDFAEKYFDVFIKMSIEKQEKVHFKDPRFQAFHEFEIERRKQCETDGIPWMPKYREKTFSGSGFMCITDRIDDNGDGTFTLVEYKNKKTSSVIQQLSFAYHIITRNYVHCVQCNEFVKRNLMIPDHEDHDIKYIEFSFFAVWYGDTPEDIYHRKPSTRSLNSMEKKMSTILPSIRAGHFPAKPGFSCQWCDYSALNHCNRQGVSLKQCTDCSKKL